MKFNIIRSELDIVKLNDRILQKKGIQYLIMNLETSEALYRENPMDNTRISKDDTDNFYTYYKGIPVAIYNGLKYGEVEII